VLEFINEEVDKTDEALEFGSLSGPENEQIGPDLSIFIDDSMYVVDDRHIWLFQPAPPPVIPAAP